MAYSLKKNLDNTKSRPAIYIEANDTNIKCLIDTGADTPVWTSGEELLLKAFPEAEIQKDLYFDLGGFGRENEEVPVYKIKEFIIKSDYDGEYIIFKNLLIACCARASISYPLILSATMFKHINYAVINLGKNAPSFKMSYNKREYEIRPILKNGKSNILDKIYSFAQNDKK